MKIFRFGFILTSNKSSIIENVFYVYLFFVFVCNSFNNFFLHIFIFILNSTRFNGFLHIWYSVPSWPSNIRFFTSYLLVSLVYNLKLYSTLHTLVYCSFLYSGTLYSTLHTLVYCSFLYSGTLYSTLHTLVYCSFLYSGTLYSTLHTLVAVLTCCCFFF